MKLRSWLKTCDLNFDVDVLMMQRQIDEGESSIVVTNRNEKKYFLVFALTTEATSLKM